MQKKEVLKEIFSFFVIIIILTTFNCFFLCSLLYQYIDISIGDNAYLSEPINEILYILQGWSPKYLGSYVKESPLRVLHYLLYMLAMIFKIPSSFITVIGYRLLAYTSMYISLRIMGFNRLSSTLTSIMYSHFAYVSVGYPWNWSYSLPLFFILLKYMINIFLICNDLKLLRITLLFIFAISLSYLMFDEYSMPVIMSIYSVIIILFYITIRKIYSLQITCFQKSYKHYIITIFIVVTLISFLINLLLFLEYRSETNIEYFSLEDTQLYTIKADIAWCYAHKDYLNTLRIVGNDGFGLSFTQIYNIETKSSYNIIGLLVIILTLFISLFYLSSEHDMNKKLNVLFSLIIFLLFILFEIYFKSVSLKFLENYEYKNSKNLIDTAVIFIIYSMRNPLKIDLIMLFHYSIIVAYAYELLLKNIIKKTKVYIKGLFVFLIIFIFLGWLYYSSPITLGLSSNVRSDYYSSIAKSVAKTIIEFEDNLKNNHRIAVLPYNHTIELVLRPLNRIAGLAQSYPYLNMFGTAVIIEENNNSYIYYDYTTRIMYLLSVAKIIKLYDGYFTVENITNPIGLVYIPDLLITEDEFRRSVFVSSKLLENFKLQKPKCLYISNSNQYVKINLGQNYTIPIKISLIINLLNYKQSDYINLINILDENNNSIINIYYADYDKFYLKINNNNVCFDNNCNNHITLPDKLDNPFQYVRVEIQSYANRTLRGAVTLSLSPFSSITKQFYLYSANNITTFHIYSVILGQYFKGLICFASIESSTIHTILVPPLNTTINFGNYTFDSDVQLPLIFLIANSDNSSLYNNYSLKTSTPKALYAMITFERSNLKSVRYFNSLAFVLNFTDISGLNVSATSYYVSLHYNFSLAPLIGRIIMSLATDAITSPIPLAINLRLPPTISISRNCNIENVIKNVNGYGLLYLIKPYDQNCQLILLFPFNIALIFINIMWLFSFLYIFIVKKKFKTL